VPAPRRGIALIVVLLMLALFAAVGLAFVLYAQSEATASRYYREAKSHDQPDVNPEVLADYFLEQLIYDADDATGIYSAMRGHSLARLMYGWDADNPTSNGTPFNGTGRLHERLSLPDGDGKLMELDGYDLINYTCFRKADGSLIDGMLHDSERLGWRTRLEDRPGLYTGGLNPPYTNPDLNNLFLAAVNSDGQVLAPSFHRWWTGFGPLDPSNPNWYDASKPWLKYLVLRPRPADMGPGFPAPEDAGGDVKNWLALPGLGARPFQCSPTFTAGYGNGAGDRPGTERWEHPLLYNPFFPTGDDRAFNLTDLTVTLSAGGWDRQPASSQLTLLCPDNSAVGTADVVQACTDDGDFANPLGTVGDANAQVPPALPPQSFFLVGPPGPDAHQTIAAPIVPGNTPLLQSPNLQYLVRFKPPDTWVPDYRRTGIAVLLRRLANPHLPFDPRPALGGNPNPAYNPFVTIDYLDRVPLNNATNPRWQYASRGKLQPYAADFSQVADQIAADPAQLMQHTFGQLDNPPANWPNPHYDWLVHLDRRLISAMELLLVSGYHPHQLTHRFMFRNPVTGQVTRFGHLVPWFDENNRLYRVFELLGTAELMSGATAGGRVPGKININTIWDPETFRALCDPQPANSFTMSDVDVNYARLTALRTPDGAPGPDDRPFLGLAVGHSPKPGDGLYPPGGDPLFPKGSGINDTLLRSSLAESGADTPRLFQVPDAPHPYLQFSLLTKIFGRLTTRSNVFAVWLTVGSFEVTDERTRPVKLGPELGRAMHANIRHRLFAIVDRSLLNYNPGTQPALRTRAASPGTGPPGDPPRLPVVVYFCILE
jgi:hypothetical protein